MQKEDSTNPISAGQKPASSLALQPSAQTIPKAPSSVVDPVAPVATPPEASVSSGGTEYAGFWIRFLALIIDSVILGVVSGIINGVFGGIIGATFLTSNQPAGSAAAGMFGFFSAIWLANIVINYAYYVILTGLYGATLGKMVLGLRVVDSNGQKIGMPKAALREIVGKVISGIVFALGYIWVAFDEKKQGWHDKIAGTYVVKVR